MSAEELEKKRKDKPRANMSAEEPEKKRKYKPRANMSAEELEKKRKYDRKEGMSAERLEKSRKTSAARSDANTQLRQEILNTASDGTYLRAQANRLSLHLQKFLNFTASTRGVSTISPFVACSLRRFACG